MIARLLGPDAPSQAQLARETGVKQQNLSRWLEEARELSPLVSNENHIIPRSVQDKVRIVARGLELSGDRLTDFLNTEGVQLTDFERWRGALENDERLPAAATKRIRQLERELTLKERALAEAATLLMLTGKVRGHYRRDDEGAETGAEEP
jgi:transcriptional regulator with XRE-family HTH domain